jgi:poly-gamma-glutamate synthesis protein (capsule biosynthesis protein)
MYFIIFFSFLQILFITQKPDNQAISNKIVSKVKPCEDSTITFRITAVGDLMCHSSQYQFAKKTDGTYDFTPVYGGVKNYLSQADITIGNLETVMAADTKDFSGYPAFNTPNEYADALKTVGFDLLFTSNNHSYDRQEKGVLRTLDELEKRKLIAIGTHRDTIDRDSIRIIDVKGVKIAFLGYTQFSNIPVSNAKKYLVNHIDTNLIVKNINKARKQGAELVLINFHWGNEYKQPNEYQEMIADFTKKAGADIIIGEHPHVLQPVEYYKTQGNSALDSGIVAYSLGNFFSSQQWRYSDAGVMLSINITKNLCTNKFKIKELSYIPTWVFKGVMDKTKGFFIFPAQIASLKLAKDMSKDSSNLQLSLVPEIKYLQKTQLLKMQQAADDTHKVLNNYGARVKIDK